MEPDGGEMGNASCFSKTRWLCAQTGPLAPEPTVSGERRPARTLRRQRRGRWGDGGGGPGAGPGLLSSERGALAGAGARGATRKTGLRAPLGAWENCLESKDGAVFACW